MTNDVRKKPWPFRVSQVPSEERIKIQDRHTEAVGAVPMVRYPRPFIRLPAADVQGHATDQGFDSIRR